MGWTLIFDLTVLTRFIFKYERLVNQPHYLVLVDKPNQGKYAHKAYLAQSEIQVVGNRKVNSSQINRIIKNINLKISMMSILKITHEKLFSYFSSYNGKIYKKKKFLSTVYPDDWVVLLFYNKIFIIIFDGCRISIFISNFIFYSIILVFIYTYFLSIPL